MYDNGYYNHIKLVGIGKSQHESSQSNWIDGNDASVCMDESPNHIVWDEWGANQRDLFVLDHEGEQVYHENISGGIPDGFEDILAALAESIPSEECFDLSGIDFGDCDMILGVGWNGFECEYFSGCDWIINDIDYSNYFFDSIQECEGNCQCEDGDIIDDDPCNPMECFDGQWYEMIIDCMEDMGVPCEGGLYIPPNEGECCSECILFGDINYDSNINILDVVEIVQLVLNGGYNEIVDINYDGTINILDIIGIIQIILD